MCPFLDGGRVQFLILPFIVSVGGFSLSSNALLALADGSLFWGQAIGAIGKSVGEVVFNTAMTGYQEILTDPSYAKQIVCLTASHVGNVGTNLADMESSRCWGAGLVVRDMPLRYSNWRAESDLSSFLKQQQVVAIADVDTRALTKRLREGGAQSGCLVAGEQIDVDDAIHQARQFVGLNNLDLAKEVTTSESYEWGEGSWQLDPTHSQQLAEHYHVVAYDFGVKHNILRLLVDRGCRLTVVPATTSAEAVLALNPDGVFLSNGPGDPAPCEYAIAAIRTVLEKGVPLFGICLGHQLLGLALGAQSKKMKFGHHGANHPVQDLDSGEVIITSQNHGFSIDEDTLPASVVATHRSLFDGSLQGLAHREKPAFGFQGHPEASPGPHDCASLFDRFIASMSHSVRVSV